MAVDDMSVEKSDLRRLALARRDALAPDYRRDAAAGVARHWRDLPVTGAETVSAFLPIKSEIDIQPLVRKLRSRVNRIVLPVVVSKQDIEFRLWIDDDSLVQAGFGTLGPGPQAPVIDPDLLLVPLAAYDDHGGRIGYGAGYYDRAITRISAQKPLLCIGVAFAAQEVEKVPMEPHDRRLDMMLTEAGLVWCDKGGKRA